MKRPRWLLYPLLTSAAVVLGLVLLRVASRSIPSAGVDFLRYRPTYLYVLAATAVVFLIVGFVLGRKIERFRRLSAIDSLTGLANRSALDHGSKKNRGRRSDTIRRCRCCSSASMD